MARYMGDDVQTASNGRRMVSGFPPGIGADFGQLNIGELTSRVASRGDRRHAGPAGGWSSTPSYDTTEAVTAPRWRQGRGKQVPDRGATPVRRGPGHLDAAGRRRRAAARADAGRRAAEEHRRVHPGLLPGRPGPGTAGPGGRARELGPAPRPGALRAVPPLPRDVLRPGRGTVGHPVLATSLERGLDGVLVSAARVMQATWPDGLSPERERRADQETSATSFEASSTRLKSHRARRAADEDAAEQAGSGCVNRLDQWADRAQARSRT